MKELLELLSNDAFGAVLQGAGALGNYFNGKDQLKLQNRQVANNERRANILFNNDEEDRKALRSIDF